jgi:hypothetical protein
VAQTAEVVCHLRQQKEASQPQLFVGQVQVLFVFGE